MRRCVGACGSYKTARQKVHHEPSEDDGDRRALRARRARARAVSPRALLRCVLRARARLAAAGRRHAHRHGSEDGHDAPPASVPPASRRGLPPGERARRRSGERWRVRRHLPGRAVARDGVRPRAGFDDARRDDARGRGRRRAARLQDPLAARCCAARARRPVRLRRARPRRDRALVARIPARERRRAGRRARRRARALAAFMRGGDDDATAGFWREGMRFGATLWEYYLEMWGAREHPPCSCSNTRPSPIRPACGARCRSSRDTSACASPQTARAPSARPASTRSRAAARATRCARHSRSRALTSRGRRRASARRPHRRRVVVRAAPRVRAAAARPTTLTESRRGRGGAVDRVRDGAGAVAKLVRGARERVPRDVERRLSAALAADAAADAEPQGLAEAPPPPPPPAIAADAPTQPPPPPPVPSVVANEGATTVRVTLPPGKAGVIMRDARDDDPFAGGHGDNPGDDAPYIRQLLPTASALLAANVAPGYRVLSINGASCAGVSADEAAEALNQAADQPARDSSSRRRRRPRSRARARARRAARGERPRGFARGGGFGRGRGGAPCAPCARCRGSRFARSHLSERCRQARRRTGGAMDREARRVCARRRRGGRGR